MGEAIITARGGTGGGEGSAILRITTQNGAIVTCTCGSQTQTKTSYGIVDFSVGYGTWTVSSAYNGKTTSDTAIVDTLKIYDVFLKRFTYGIQINMDIADPESAVSYIDDAVGMTPLSCDTATTGACNYGSWEDIITNWIGCKPCLYKDGKRVAYLNPNNYNKKIDGSAADITSGNSGDVMVEFAKRWYKFSSPNATTLKFEIADYDRSADGFTTAAFLSEDGNAAKRDFFYYGVYNGYVESNKLRSLSNEAPSIDISYEDSILRASQNHSCYTIETLFKRVYILGLLMLVTKSRGIQAKIGHGNVNNSYGTSTGTMNDKGLFYGRNDNTSGVKCFGIEHMWGNISGWLAGLVTRNNIDVLGVKACAPYSVEGINYINVITGMGSNGGYPTRCAQFADGAIMLPIVIQGNNTIGWPDYFYFNGGPLQVGCVGGARNSRLDFAGPFCATLNGPPSSTGSICGPRLVGS